MAELFGFRIERPKKAEGSVPSFTSPTADDGTVDIAGGGFFGQILDQDGRERTEIDLIRRYRDIAQQPECDTAIEDIVNEGIISNEDDVAVQITLDRLPFPEKIKRKIRTEFMEVLRLLHFNAKGHDVFRRWYVDGRIFFHKIIDTKNPKQGIIELRYIDPTKIKKVRQIKKKKDDNSSVDMIQKTDEYFLYNEKGINSAGMGGTNSGIKIAADAIAYCPSGLIDGNSGRVLSYLHKAIKPVNQLRMIEDALVIYRISRAPERRIFYIDVGNLPKIKAEQYLKDVMNRYRNKLVYDAATGEIRDDKKHMSMLEDFWLPRREGGRGTEITTLPGGQNLGELKDVEYFKKKLYNSLNLPPSRLTDDNKGFNLGKTTEVLRDELKFSKFIGRLRKRFSGIFHDTLKTQLILKGVIAPEDWDEMAEHIQYDYIHDNHFNELKELEMETSRINLVTQMDPYVGKYYSVDYIRRSVLGHKDEDIKEQDKLMSKEIDAGIVADPADLNTFDMMDRQNSAYQPEISAQQADDAHERSLEASKEQAKLKPAPSKTSSNAK